MKAGAWLLAALCGTAIAGEPAVWQEPVTGMRFVALAKGCFRMGSPAPVRPKEDFIWEHLGYRGHLAADEMPQHEACVDAFWIGRYEVRADEWEKVMGRAPPSGSGRAPAAGMTWDEAQAFARRLGELSGDAARFRLPTEAEWEYACRAGDDGNPQPDIKKKVEDARYNGWSGVYGYQALEAGETGALPANRWGLHDMLGNVWEWVEDAYRADAYARHALFNPVTAGAGAHMMRVLRGASHRSEYLQVRCATRGSHAADAALPQIGLRLVRREKKQ